MATNMPSDLRRAHMSSTGCAISGVRRGAWGAAPHRGVAPGRLAGGLRPSHQPPHITGVRCIDERLISPVAARCMASMVMSRHAFCGYAVLQCNSSEFVKIVVKGTEHLAHELEPSANCKSPAFVLPGIVGRGYGNAARPRCSRLGSSRHGGRQVCAAGPSGGLQGGPVHLRVI